MFLFDFLVVFRSLFLVRFEAVFRIYMALRGGLNLIFLPFYHPTAVGLVTVWLSLQKSAPLGLSHENLVLL